MNKIAKGLAEAVVGILNQLSLEMLVGTGRDITRPLHNSVSILLASCRNSIKNCYLIISKMFAATFASGRNG